MNLSAPVSVPDAKGLALLLTAGNFTLPSAAVVSKSANGALPKPSFQAAFKDLLPTDSEREPAPSAEKGLDVTQSSPAATAVPVQSPIPAPETKPLEFAWPWQPIGPRMNTEKPTAPQTIEPAPAGPVLRAEYQPYLLIRPAVSTASAPMDARLAPAKTKGPFVKPISDPATAATMNIAAPVVAAPVAPQAELGSKEMAKAATQPQGHPGSAPLRSAIEAGPQAPADSALIESQPQVAAEETTEAPLPNLAFTARITPLSETATPVTAVAVPVSPGPPARPTPNPLSDNGGEKWNESKPPIADSAAPTPVTRGAETVRSSDRRDQNDPQGRPAAHTENAAAATKETPAPPESPAEKITAHLQDTPLASAGSERSARPSSASDTAQTRAPETAPATPTPANPKPVEAHTISLRVADTGDQRIDLKVTDRGGDVRVTVRTSDPETGVTLRENLHDLSHKLEQSGFRTETMAPSQAASADTNSNQGRPPGQSFSGNHGGDRQQQQQGQQRRQQDPETASWNQELEDRLQSEPERNIPTWASASIL